MQIKNLNQRLQFWGMFLLNPLFSFLYFLYRIKNKKIDPLFFISLFMALCGILSPPFADAAVHAFSFQLYKDMSFDIFVQSCTKDYILPILCFVFGKVGLDFGLIRGLLVFICYQISFFLFRNLIFEKNKGCISSNKFFCIFLCFFLSVPFIWIVTGMRSATSCYLMVLASYFASKRNLFWTCFWALFSVWTHFFSWIFVPILILRYFKVRITKNTFIILLGLFTISGPIIFNLLLSGDSSFVMETTNMSSDTKDVYMNEYNYSLLNANGMIAFALERSPLILMIFYAIFSSKKWESRCDQSYFYFCILLLSICLTFYIPFQRISWLVAPIMIYLFLKNNFSRNINLLVISVFLSQIMYFYEYTDACLNTPFGYLFLPINYSLLYSYPLDFDLLDL